MLKLVYLIGLNSNEVRMLNNKKLFALLVLALSSQAMAEKSLSVSRKVISGNDVKTSVGKLSTEKIAKLALSGKLGTCTATYNGPGTSYMFSYNYSNTNSEIAMLGGRSLIVPIATEQVGINLSFSPATTPRTIAPTQRLNSAISVMNTNINTSIVSLSPVAANLETLAMQQLGAKIKEKLDIGQCGTVNFESRTVNFKEFNADTVKFYKGADGSLICTTTGLENDVADGCSTKKVTSFLPTKVCRLVYQVARGKSNVTRTSLKPTFTFLGPAILPITIEVEQDLAIDKALKNPSISHLFSFEKSLNKPVATNYLPADVLDVLKDKNLDHSKFADLSDDVKFKLSNAVLTIEATKTKPEVVQFPTEINQLATNLKSNVELYMMTNRTTKNFVSYEIPKESTVLAAVAEKLRPITTDILRPAITSFHTCRALPPSWINASAILTPVENPSEDLLADVSNASNDTAIATAFVNEELRVIGRNPASANLNVVQPSLITKYTTNPAIQSLGATMLLQRVPTNFGNQINTINNAGNLTLPNSLPAPVLINGQ